jgi:UDP:flavonoid glycosyltransferase YjiC (YdhE family)
MIAECLAVGKMDGKLNSKARGTCCATVPRDDGSQTPRLLFLGEAVALAHVGRPTVLARWAQDAGYDVFFACGDSHAHIPQKESLRTFDLKTIPTFLHDRRIERGEFWYAAEDLRAYVRAELELYKQLQPDLIVADYRLSASISAAVAGIPLVKVMNAYWSPSCAIPLPPPNHGVWENMPLALRRTLFAAIRPLAHRVFCAPVLNRIRREHGLPTYSDFRRHWTDGTWCVYPDLTEFIPLHALPPHHFFMGPLVWQPQSSPTALPERFGRERPGAYVTLGGTGDGRRLETVLRVLLNADYDVVLSGVPERTTAAFNNLPPQAAERLWTRKLLNPESVLRRAQITVCHGGSGTVYQSLAAGVPVLCLPGNPDQSFVAEAVVRRNLGVTIPVEQATEKRLAAAVAAVREKCAHGARQLQNALSRSDTKNNWLSFLSRILGANAVSRTPADAGVFASADH